MSEIFKTIKIGLMLTGLLIANILLILFLFACIAFIGKVIYDSIVNISYYL